MTIGAYPIGDLPIADVIAAGGNNPPTGSVTISGTPTQNETLTASNTLADADGLGTITYQWLRDDVEISGATNTTYDLVQADVGAVIKVRADYTDGLGTPESVTSSGTTVVANVNDDPTGSVTIAGDLIEGSTLTASNTIADVDGLGTITYQWLADDVEISGAVNSTYTLQTGDVGAIIKARVDYADGEGTAESVTSAGYGPVATLSGSSYQQCILPITIDKNWVEGIATFMPFVFNLREQFVTQEFIDSVENGGGNLRVYRGYPLDDSNRLAIDINAFDTGTGNVDVDILLNSLVPTLDKTIYLKKGDPSDTQPAASDPFGADEVTNAVPLPANADLTATIANNTNEDTFASSGTLTCSIVGNSSVSGEITGFNLLMKITF